MKQWRTGRTKGAFFRPAAWDSGATVGGSGESLDVRDALWNLGTSLG